MVDSIGWRERRVVEKELRREQCRDSRLTSCASQGTHVTASPNLVFSTAFVTPSFFLTSSLAAADSTLPHRNYAGHPGARRPGLSETEPTRAGSVCTSQQKVARGRYPIPLVRSLISIFICLAEKVGLPQNGSRALPPRATTLEVKEDRT